MSKTAMGCGVAVVVIVLLALVVGMMAAGWRNDLVNLEEGVDAQWAQVESVYQRRADLIPNLVATVKGAAEFEKSTLEAVTQARASVGQVQAGPNPTGDPQAFARWQAAQDQLSSALSRLLVVVERYPDLKANQNFRDLQAQLEGTENRISVERMRFNDAARDYNATRKRVPHVLVANMFGFEEKPYFRSAPGAETAPTVDFEFGASPAPAPGR